MPVRHFERIHPLPPHKSFSPPFRPPHPLISLFLPPHPSHPLRFTRSVQSILPIRRFPSKITQISNAMASTAFSKAVYTPHSQSILAIMTTQRTENLVFRASAQSNLPQTTAHPCKPVDSRQNARLLPFTLVASTARPKPVYVLSAQSGLGQTVLPYPCPFKPPYPARKAHIALLATPKSNKRIRALKSVTGHSFRRLLT